MLIAGGVGGVGVVGGVAVFASLICGWGCISDRRLVVPSPRLVGHGRRGAAEQTRHRRQHGDREPEADRLRKLRHGTEGERWERGGGEGGREVGECIEVAVFHGRFQVHP